MSGLWFPSYAGIAHKKTSGGNGGTGPESVPGCWCWYDASQSGDITKDGSNNVTEWLDHSGNGCHLTASGTNGPVYSATALGDVPLPGIIFSANKGLLNATSAGLNAFKNRSAVWIIMAWRYASPVADTNYFQWTTNGSSSNHRFNLRHADATYNYWNFKKRTADSDSEFSANSASWAGVPTDRNVFLIIDIQYGNALAHMYQSYHTIGTEILGATFDNSNSTDDTASQASAFGGANGQTGMNYSLGEFLLYTETPSTANRAALITYLSNKWWLG
jgi:hypothetical protein